MAPGAYDCLSARLAEEAGFPVVYMTGAGISVSRYGVPDLGLVTQTEMVAAAGAIARAVEVPVIADADTGYGGVRNVARTVAEFERAGVAGIQLEDQEFPKRCGHLDDKRVIDADEMAEKIRAACEARTDPELVIVARTDALATDGLDEALRRAELYAAAGADVLFVEALRSREEAERVASVTRRPLLYNVVESGKSPLLAASDLERLGFKIAIFPATALLTAMAAIRRSFGELRERGSTAHLAPTMPTIVECFELVGLGQYLARDHRSS